MKCTVIFLILIKVDLLLSPAGPDAGWSHWSFYEGKTKCLGCFKLYLLLPRLLICLFLFRLLGSWPAAWQWSDCAGSWEQEIQEVMIVEPLSPISQQIKCICLLIFLLSFKASLNLSLYWKSPPVHNNSAWYWPFYLSGFQTDLSI